MLLSFRNGVMLVVASLLALQFAFLPGPGIQEDEALFVAPFLRDNPALYEWRAGGLHIPVMSMDYLGALKSWLYWPVFQVWHPNVWSMRLPVCLLSALTLLLFTDLARRVAGKPAALAAALLLGTDAVFVLINVFDMTVCLLLLATVAFLGLLQRFAVSGDKRLLGLAFSVAGLALWYKAILLFPLAAMLLAFAIAYPEELRRRLTLRNIAAAAVCLMIGAAPLIAFNWERHGATFQASANLPAVPAREKLVMLEHTLDGRAFEHYMFRSTLDEKIPITGGAMGDLVVRWYRESHFGPGSALLPALALSLVALPFLRASALFRPLLFCWVAMPATFGAMLIFHDAGAGPHHTVLLDPAPQFIVAASAAALAERWFGWSRVTLLMLCVLVAGSNLWLLGQYARAARNNGFSVYWTDAVTNLASVIQRQNLPVAAMEWGVRNGVQIESHDTVKFVASLPPRESVLYATHCDGYVIDQAGAAQFQERVAASGLHVTANRAVADKKGHLIFCLFQLAKD